MNYCPDVPLRLHSSAAAGNKDVCRLLIDAGADINNEDDMGCTALDVAMDKGDEDMICLLKSMGGECHKIMGRKC